MYEALDLQRVKAINQLHSETSEIREEATTWLLLHNPENCSHSQLITLLETVVQNLQDIPSTLCKRKEKKYRLVLDKEESSPYFVVIKTFEKLHQVNEQDKVAIPVVPFKTFLTDSGRWNILVEQQLHYAVLGLGFLFFGELRLEIESHIEEAVAENENLRIVQNEIGFGSSNDTGVLTQDKTNIAGECDEITSVLGAIGGPKHTTLQSQVSTGARPKGTVERGWESDEENRQGIGQDRSLSEGLQQVKAVEELLKEAREVSNKLHSRNSPGLNEETLTDLLERSEKRVLAADRLRRESISKATSLRRNIQEVNREIGGWHNLGRNNPWENNNRDNMATVVQGAQKRPKFEGRRGEDFEEFESKLNEYIRHYKIDVTGKLPTLKEALGGDALLMYKSILQAEPKTSFAETMTHLREYFMHTPQVPKIKRKLHTMKKNKHESMSAFMFRMIKVTKHLEPEHGAIEELQTLIVDKLLEALPPQIYRILDKKRRDLVPCQVIPEALKHIEGAPDEKKCKRIIYGDDYSDSEESSSSSDSEEEHHSRKKKKKDSFEKKLLGEPRERAATREEKVPQVEAKSSTSNEGQDLVDTIAKEFNKLSINLLEWQKEMAKTMQHSNSRSNDKGDQQAAGYSQGNSQNTYQGRGRGRGGYNYQQNKDRLSNIPGQPQLQQQNTQQQVQQTPQFQELLKMVLEQHIQQKQVMQPQQQQQVQQQQQYHNHQQEYMPMQNLAPHQNPQNVRRAPNVNMPAHNNNWATMGTHDQYHGNRQRQPNTNYQASFGRRQCYGCGSPYHMIANCDQRPKN